MNGKTNIAEACDETLLSNKKELTTDKYKNMDEFQKFA